jgi:hypothetical protein
MAVPIQGTAVATFDSTVPITMKGEYSVTISGTVTRAYGQGDGSPGSGYVGSAIGTKKSGTGNFHFAVDQAGAEIQRVIRQGLLNFFTLDFPLGDPNQGASNAQFIDCKFDSLNITVDNPEGNFTIDGTMSFGDCGGPAFEVPTA